MADYRLLETGDYKLLEDNTSKQILESYFEKCSLYRAEAPDLTSDEVFEFLLWFKISRLSGTSRVYWKFEDEIEIEIGFADGETDGYIKATVPSLSVESGNILTDGIVYHSVIYFDASELGLRINDEEVDTDVGSSTGISSQGAEIWMNNYQPGTFSILIDEPLYYVGANLSAANRTAHYNAGYGARPTFA